jgi:hypothetical protein
MLELEDIRALGQICNHTWGGSSTNLSPTMSVKGRFIGENKFQVEFTTIFRIVSDRDLVVQNVKVRAEAESLVDSYLKEVKKEFKKRRDKTVSFKQVAQHDSNEIIAVQRHVSLDKTVKFMFKAIFEVS